MADDVTKDHPLVLRDEAAPRWRNATATLVTRTFTTRADGAEPEEHTVEELEISISSEEPVERMDWWSGTRYDEVLSHQPDEIDLAYARDGLPFFVDHESRRMVGLVDPVRLDPDGKLRGPLRFGSHPDAAWVEKDMRAGIRKKISVGYDYNDENYTEEKRGERIVRTVRGWRPLEASSVPIPADYTVGVGRSARPGAPQPAAIPGETPIKGKESVAMSTTAAPDGAQIRVQVQEEMQGRVREIRALAKQHGLEARSGDWLEQGATIEQVRAEILEHHRKRSEETLARGGQGNVLDLSAKDERRFSFARAIQSQLMGTRGFEQEISDELYSKTGRKRTHPNAILVPTQFLGRDVDVTGKRLAVATSGAGQQLRFTDYGGFLGLLRPRMVTGRLGITTLSGLQGDLSFVTQPSANTFQWGAETFAPTATNFGTGLKTMSPKNGAALTTYTRQLLSQSVEAIEGLVQDDLMKICAIALDVAAINGGGGTAPTGILGTTGIGSVTMGANGAVPTFPKIVDLWTETAIDNADTETMAYATTPGIAGYLQQTQKFSGTNGIPIWEWSAPGEGLLNGHRAVASTNVPSNLTKGTNTGTCHGIVFGDWSSLIVGEWGAMELIVDPYSAKPTYIQVAAHLMADVMLRYVEKFAAIQDARTS